MKYHRKLKEVSPDHANKTKRLLVYIFFIVTILSLRALIQLFKVIYNFDLHIETQAWEDNGVLFPIYIVIYTVLFDFSPIVFVIIIMWISIQNSNTMNVDSYREHTEESKISSNGSNSRFVNIVANQHTFDGNSGDT
jgi:hypothetical protein